jgi:hypothetical protein
MSDTIGTYYYQPEKPQPVELLVNPPYASGTEYDASCGTGAFLVEAEKRIVIVEPNVRACGEMEGNI